MSCWWLAVDCSGYQNRATQKETSICLNSPLPRAVRLPAFIPPAGFFSLTSCPEERAENRKLSKGNNKGWNPCCISLRRDIQSASLVRQQLETQKWRPWKLLTLCRSLRETSKGLCRDEGGQEVRAPSAPHSSCSSQILQHISLEKRNARTETKTHRKKHPTVLISMDTIKAKAFKEGCTHLRGSDPEPSEADGCTPRNLKGFGIKALYL